MNQKKILRKIIIATISLFLLVVLVPASFLFWNYIKTPKVLIVDTVPQHINDASFLNQTPINEIVTLNQDMEKAESLIKKALRKAQKHKIKISVGGARHSMGGQSFTKKGIYIDTDGFNKIEIIKDKKLLHVQAGARWRDIIPKLHEQNLAVNVMQSNNDFSVGGTLSVNAHGWQHGSGPVSSTVESFRLMLADGTIKNCSRKENPELFKLVLGGYGLFGVILDVWIKVIDNEMYQSKYKIVKLKELVKTWDNFAKVSKVKMLYARLSINPDSLFSEALVTGYYKIPWDKPFPKLVRIKNRKISRVVFRSSAGSDFGKRLRWQLEKSFGGEAHGVYARSSLQNEPASVFANTNKDYTDILHEYFVPPSNFTAFAQEAAHIIQKNKLDLLNVTVRNVDQDQDTVLRYADQNMLSLVMLFNQKRNSDEENVMKKGTRELIEAALKHKGRYYLPYRLHATKDQFQRAYPQYQAFAASKNNWDPLGIFSNTFYEKYF